MRVLIALVVVIYLIGVGVALAPAFQTNVGSAASSDIASRVAQSLPDALGWPSRAYRDLSERL